MYWFFPQHFPILSVFLSHTSTDVTHLSHWCNFMGKTCSVLLQMILPQLLSETTAIITPRNRVVKY